MSKPFFQTLENAPRVGAAGDLYRYLADNTQVGGAFSLLHATVPPGGGPPPHIHHREQEAFYVLKGQITIYVEGQKVVAGPGSFANLPKGIPHNFRNESSEDVEMLVLIVPGGFEQMLLETGTLGAQAPLPMTPEEMQRMAGAVPRYGVEFIH